MYCFFGTKEIVPPWAGARRGHALQVRAASTIKHAHREAVALAAYRAAPVETWGAGRTDRAVAAGHARMRPRRAQAHHTLRHVVALGIRTGTSTGTGSGTGAGTDTDITGDSTGRHVLGAATCSRHGTPAGFALPQAPAPPPTSAPKRQ